jgi:ribose-phosphate pyrophosphokinase
MKKSTEKILIISGSSHPALAQAVAKKLRVKLLDAEMQYFSNGEVRPVLRESVRHKDIFIIQTGGGGRGSALSVNDLIIETLILIKTLKRSDVGRITLVMPFLPYCRQDKKDNPRGAISAQDIAHLFETAGVHRFVTFDLHAAQIQGFFEIPCDNLYTAHLIKQYFDTHLFKKGYQDKYVLVAPDEGALKRMREYAGMFKLPLFALSKERDYRKKNEVEKTVLIGESTNLKGKTAIVIDDMIDTFGTLNAASVILKEHGAASMIVAATHGILSGPALNRISQNDFVDQVIVSDSIPQEGHIALCSKLRLFSLESMIASAIGSLEEGRSLSDLFQS